jgi:hypothetical protein
MNRRREPDLVVVFSCPEPGAAEGFFVQFPVHLLMFFLGFFRVPGLESRHDNAAVPRDGPSRHVG